MVRWVCLGALVGLACGVASAGFLALLELATHLRVAYPALVFGLPLAGAVIGLALQRWGQPFRGGSNQVIAAARGNGEPLPTRMGPMVLAGTVLTHLFGGSAGREGTAVQMGASLADELSRRLKLSADDRRTLLIAGISGGFGSVFGTPFAGALFGLEVVRPWRLQLAAAVPALVASGVGDLCTRLLGVRHTAYPTAPALALDPVAVGKWVVFAVAVAAAARAFVEAVHGVKGVVGHLTAPSARLAAGGLAVVLLWQLTGTDAYLGLGVPSIVRVFDDASGALVGLGAKTVFTALTVGAGFLGGEVTPLFFVGSHLGAALSGPLQLPLRLCAAVGLAAVFGAASRSPIALSVMAMELCGLEAMPHVLLVSCLAAWMTGGRGLYPAQREGAAAPSPTGQ